MKHVNDVKKVSNKKFVLICKKWIKGGTKIWKEVMRHEKKKDKKKEKAQ